MTAPSRVLKAWPAARGLPAEAETDLDLVERTKKGEVEAFSVLVRRHQQDVFDLAYRFVRDRSLAEDMAQEAFIKSYRLLRGFRGDSAFSTWLYRVTCNVCLTELTRRKKRSEVALLPEQAHVPAHAPLPETRDAAELVWRCVARLPDRYATALTLYYLNQRSYEAIAEAMRIPLGTVKTWMHRARHQLRRLVEKELA